MLGGLALGLIGAMAVIAGWQSAHGRDVQTLVWVLVGGLLVLGSGFVAGGFVGHRRRERLADALAAAAALNRQKAAFLAQRSLDLRTPIVEIQTRADRLAEADMSPALRREARQIVGWSRDLTHALADLHELALLEQGMYPLNPEPLDLAVEVEARAALFQDRAEVRGLRLEVCTPLLRPFGDLDPLCARAAAGSRDTTVVLDPDAIQRILKHLIGHALVATDVGVVRIVVAAEEDVVRLFVQDTGRGMDPDDALPGEPAPLGTGIERAYWGYDLPLLLARYLVERQGGRLDVERVEGQGSTYTISLPPYTAARA